MSRKRTLTGTSLECSHEPHFARDMCKNCYGRWRHLHSPEARKIKIAGVLRSRAANPNKYKDSQYRRRYGIGLEGVNKLLGQQGQRCAICSTDTPINNKWMVDHDHETKHIRGILCMPCNVGLGSFQDKIENLWAAIVYLRDPAADRLKGELSAAEAERL